MSRVEEKLAQMGMALPDVPDPPKNRAHGKRAGDLVFVGVTPAPKPDGTEFRGKLGADISIEEAYEAARYAGLALLARLKILTGDLDKIRIVRLLCMVNCTPDFVRQPEVANGVTDFLVEIYGEEGKHARCAVGMGSLPNGVPIEVEMIAEVGD